MLPIMPFPLLYPFVYPKPVFALGLNRKAKKGKKGEFGQFHRSPPFSPEAHSQSEFKWFEPKKCYGALG